MDSVLLMILFLGGGLTSRPPKDLLFGVSALACTSWCYFFGRTETVLPVTCVTEAGLRWSPPPLVLSNPFAITFSMEIKCFTTHEDTPMLFCSPPHSCVFAAKVNVTGKCVLENSLLKLPVPVLAWQREGLCGHFHSPAAKDISPPRLPSLSMPLPLGAQAGSSSLQVGAILGEDLALLRCL